jgi:asparagine synthase (glutamine-hydrolysing)
MTSQLVHRGPDADGAWIDQNRGIALGHRRLSIIDLSEAGHQPMISACGRFVLAFNGEIYNHMELRARLGARVMTQWKGHSDTETILACISRWGVRRTLEEAVGMFALALWDRSDCSLSLARDRMGEKPLYYGWVAGQFAFGSELKALMAVPGFDNPVSRDALDALLRWGYVPSPLSIYQGIYKLIPGSLITMRAEHTLAPPSEIAGHLSGGEIGAIERFWDLTEVTREAMESPVLRVEEAIDGLEQRLVEAIHLQSYADVPVGTFLSGGIDSTTIAALQQRHSASKVETFTIGFHEPGFDESENARAVANHIGTAHHEMYVTSRDALNVIPDLPRIYDEPFADSSQIPTYLLSRIAKIRVTVALSGDGADEVFGGYNRYVAFPRLYQRFAQIPGLARLPLASLLRLVSHCRMERIGAWLKGFHSIPFLHSKAEKAAEVLQNGKELSKFSSILLSQWPASCHPVTGAGHNTRFPSLPRVPGLGQAGHLMLWDALHYLPDDILCKVDRAAMAASLETRAPFLDHRVVEFAARMPTSMKVRPDGSKWVLRQLLYRYVPRRLIDRPKSGFSVPLAAWLRGPLREWADELLRVQTLSAENYFDFELLRTRWESHLLEEYDYSAALWPVLMFQSWLSAQSDHRSEVAAQSRPQSRRALEPVGASGT